MKFDPVLASKTLPVDPDQGRRHPHTFIVKGGLHYLRGNDLPYFSLTYTEHRQGFPNQEESDGAGHKVILQHFPQFADLATLHLSDIDGVPTGAEANGWYQLAGALGGFGEKYHAGNNKGNYPLSASQLDPTKLWRTTEYRYPTHEECLESFARHCRIRIKEAKQIRADVTASHEKVNDFGFFTMVAPDITEVRARWAAICDGMRPRWQTEARSCILNHRLQVYGDPWEGDCLPSSPPRSLPDDCTAPEQTYIDHWGITSTATPTDSNPNMNDGSDMNHWRVTLHCGRRKMTTYYSMGSGHGGREPTAQEVIDCIAQDGASVENAEGFEEWARDIGYDTDSRRAHRTYVICKRQTERLQKFLGAERYTELMGG